jgi:hypothetical protein
MIPQRLAQVGIGILLLVVIRSLAEYFRLRYVHGDALTIAQVTPYVAGALFAAVALALTVACYLAARHRASIGIAIATVVSLLIYKVAVVG